MRGNLLAIGLICTLALTACSSPGVTEGADVAEDSLVLALGDVTSSEFDPRNGWGQHLEHKILHSSLVKWDSEMELTGDLAVDWKNQGTTWTFNLNPDFRFSDGEPVTADDVVFTLETLKEDGANFDLSNLEEVHANDEHTVAIELAEPDALFGPMLATIAILPEHAYDNDYAHDPVGSGPYRVVEHQFGEQLIMAANDYYPEEIKYRNLTFLLSEEDSALAATDAGEVDVAYVSASNADRSFDGMHLNELDSVDSLGIVLPTIAAGRTGETMGVEGLVGNDVTADPAIRKALAAAIDREELNDLVLGGYGKPAYSFADDLPWYTERVEYSDGDIEGAKRILGDAGWEDTNGDGTIDKDGLEAVVPLLYSVTDTVRADLAETFATQAEQIGIRFEPEGVTWDDIYAEGKSSAVVWAIGSLSPKELWETYSSEVIDVGYNNMANYRNAEVDAHLEDARATDSLTDSYGDWQAAQQAGASSNPEHDVPVLWMLRRNHLYLTRDGVDIGDQVVHGHGHGLQIFQNVSEWS